MCIYYVLCSLVTVCVIGLLFNFNTLSQFYLYCFFNDYDDDDDYLLHVTVIMC